MTDHPVTPTTPSGLRQFDHLDAIEAVVRAWHVGGPRPDWHRRMKAAVRDEMPLLARALDRLAVSPTPTDYDDDGWETLRHDVPDETEG